MATVTRDVVLAWRLGTTFSDEETFSKHVTFASNFDYRATAEEAVDVVQPYPEEEFGGVFGTVPLPSITPPASAAMGYAPEYYGDIYERIWIVPRLLTVQNPQLSVDIPFVIWSAYLDANTLNTINTTGATGLTLDISTPLSFLPVEEKTANLQIGSTAPAIIDAQFEFLFDFGSGTLDFETTLYEWIQEEPDSSVVEFWDWLTDILDAEDSTEQRIRIREQPRISFEYEQLINNTDERREWYDRFYSHLDDVVVAGAWQYATRVTAQATSPDTKIFCTTSKTDFRDGDFIIVYRPSDGTSYLLKAASSSAVDADGINLQSSLTVTIEVRDLIMPAYEALLSNRTGLSMSQVSGTVKPQLRVKKERASFKNPNSSATIDTFDSLNVLDRRPVVTRSAAPEIFDAGYTLFDNEQGQPEPRQSWLHTMLQGRRQFFIPRKINPTELDYWRDFLGDAYGMQKSFLMPTWMEDLVLASTPVQGALQIEVTGAKYATSYAPYDTYTRLWLTNPSGTVIYRKVDSAAAQPGDISLVTLTTPLPNEAAWANGFTIFFLNRVRLSSDRVKLTHGAANTILELGVRTCNQ